MTAAEMLHQLLWSRRSIRKFTAERVPVDTIEALIEAATSAPSASNKQPWRFFVVERGPTLEAMVSAVQTAVAEVAEHVLEECQDAFRAYGDYFSRFAEAPIVIVPICRGHTVLSNLCKDTLDREVRERILAMERDSAVISTALAIQNLLLTAHAQGLGASAMTGPLVASHELRRLLDVPTGWSIVAVIPVGFPAEVREPTSRKSIDKVTRWIR